ncbi:MAG TPA: hypothetical protein DD381_02285 [Lentisphaeria bacterium]|nr:MAG: hypothetical protein A2X47_08750 [Lentisphaerae bacterium GWF2_38_69]HBM15165.1 hypothetical protein [Lentisphaeria bacterium]
MRNFIKSSFSLVEIVLAIGILALGAIGILAIFPTGISQNRDSIGATYSSIAADIIFAYLSRETNEPTPKWNTVMSNLPTSTGDNEPPYEIKPSSVMDTSAWNIPEESIIYIASDVDIDNNPLTKGIFGIKIKTGDVVDFTGEAIVWRQLFYKTPSSDPFYLRDLYVAGYTEDKETSIDSTKKLANIEAIVAGINIEISYPADKPYSKRTKNRYYFEIFNFNNVTPGGIAK